MMERSRSLQPSSGGGSVDLKVECVELEQLEMQASSASPEIENHINAVGSRAIAISSSSSSHATTLLQREKSAILEKLAAAVLKAQGFAPADKISLTDVVAICVSVCHNRLPKLDLQQYSMFALWQFIISRFLIFFYMLWLELIGAGK